MIPQDILSRKRLITIADTMFLPVIIICVGIVSFFIGRFSALDACRGHIIIHPPGSGEALAVPTAATPGFFGETDTAMSTSTNTGPHNFVASKNGSKYYLPTCSGVKAIAQPNRVYFSTKTEAVDAGYTPATNCKGM